MAYSRTLNHFTSMQELATIWASSTSYVVNQLVINSDKLYRCLIAHTSTASFATDLGAGNWVEVSASASGVKNYITNGNFENSSTSGWNLARSTLDATTKLPNQASGSWTAAAGTLSRTIVTSGQLSGVASLSLASSAATTAGDMLVTDALTLDLEAQASVQTFSFYYRVTSGASNGNFSGTSSNSIGVAIYVVDGALAGTWIQPAGVWSVNTASSVTAVTAKAAGTFQVPSDATQVRLAVYFPNASTGAITVYLDDFVLGPQVVQYGAPVTDWQSYTPTITNLGTGSTSSSYGKYRRVGDSIEIEFRWQKDGSTGTGAGNVTMSLPSGLSVDSSKIPNSVNAPSGQIYVSGAATVFMPAVDPTGIVFFNQTSAAQVTGSQVPANSAWVGSVNNIPILGWSSSVQMSNDTDTRVVAAQYSGNAGTTVTANSTNIPFTTLINDTHAAWGGSSYTAPVSGYYSVSGAVNLTASNNSDVSIYKDGVVGQTISSNYNTAAATRTFNGFVYLNAGQVLSVRLNITSTLLNSATLHFININRISGPSAIAASETVAARYVATGNRTPTSSKSVNYDSKVFDTHGAVTTVVGDIAGWKFTCPIAGKYSVSVVTYSSTALVSSLFVAKNGATAGFLASCNIGNVLQSGTILVDSLAGDTLDIRSDSTPTLNNVAANVLSVSIHRVGN